MLSVLLRPTVKSTLLHHLTIKNLSDKKLLFLQVQRLLLVDFSLCPVIDLDLFPQILLLFITLRFIRFAEEAAEEEPKFIPFTGPGRRLDGKAPKDKDVSASSPAKRQANATNSVQPSTASTSQSSSSRKTTGKLVFGPGGNRISKETEKVGIFAIYAPIGSCLENEC